MGARKASWEQACAGGKPHRERHYNNSVSGRSKAGEVLDLLENEGAGCISQRGIGGARGAKRTRREMTNCEEARFHLPQCGIKSLGGDKDGKPCEGLGR